MMRALPAHNGVKSGVTSTTHLRELEERIDAWPHHGPYWSVGGALAGEQPDTLRGLMQYLGDRFPERSAKVSLPPSVMALYGKDIARICAQTKTRPSEFYQSGFDPFLQDLCIASQRMIPVGVTVVHRTAVSWRLILSVALQNPTVSLFFLRAGGLCPWFEAHIHYPALNEFNEQGWREFNRRVADMLEIDRDVKGVFGTTWFLDPAVREISPSLAYWREIPLKNGAFSFRLGTSEKDIRLATKACRIRRKLYQEGKYLPTSYALFWPRFKILEWARQQQ
jgi:hypothetical protein